MRSGSALADPRRAGSVIGIAGGLTFVLAYSSDMGHAAAGAARVVATGLAVASLWALYARTVDLELPARPRRMAGTVFACCAVGEVVVIGVGSGLLAWAGRNDLRPALIAAAVGLHLMPMGRAFNERLFVRLGGAVSTLGGLGMLAGVAGAQRGPGTAAATAGMVMLAAVGFHASGRFDAQPVCWCLAGRGRGRS